MKIKLLFFVLFFSLAFIASLNAQIVVNNVELGLNIVRSFSDNSFSPAEFYVHIPDTGATYFNLHTAIGYNIKLNKKENLFSLPYIEVEKNTLRKSKRDNYKLGILLNYIFSDSSKNFILDNFLDLRYKRDFITKKYNTYSSTLYINPYFPLVKNDFLKAIIPGGTRLSLIENILKYRNNFALGFDYTRKINDASEFYQHASGQIKLDWSLYFLREKRDMFDLNLSYHFGMQFIQDADNRKYFNLFKTNLTYYFINDGKNSAGIRYEYVRGDDPIDDVNYDNFQKIMLTFKVVIF